MEFNYYLPANLIFGRGKLSVLGETTVKYGSKAIIVTGQNSTKKSGVLDRVIQNLDDNKVEYVVFDKVMQNPLIATAIEGAECAKEHGCDVVVAVGGGSVIDCAKGAAFIAENGNDIEEYMYNRKLSEKALPVVAVPTTCGTGSEGNCFAVLTNSETGDKKSLRCNAIIPKASILDSELMESMPKSVLNAVGFDAFCHNLEGYISKRAQPITDMLAVQGMTLAAQSLRALNSGDGRPENWDNLTLASLYGGMVINTTSVTLAHNLEHPASGLRDIVHAKGLAAIMPSVMRKTLPSIKTKSRVISKCLGGTDEKDCLPMLEKFIKEIGMKTNLSEQGIQEVDVEWMTENHFKVNPVSAHPIDFSREEIRAIYLSAI